MQPGVNHCWGGEGPDTFDAVGALERWVQTGTRARPHRRLAYLRPGVDLDTRPLCPYPQVAEYKAPAVSIRRQFPLRGGEPAAERADGIPLILIQPPVPVVEPGGSELKPQQSPRSKP